MVLAEYLFLVLLVMVSYAVYRAKERYFYKLNDTYNKLMLGVACWALLLFVRVLAEGGLASQLPVLQREEYRNLAEALFLAAGAIFLAVGVAEWIAHLAAADLRSTHYRRRLDLLSSVVASARKQLGIPEFLESVRSAVSHFTGASSVSYYQTDETSSLVTVADAESLPLAEDSPLHFWCHAVQRTRRLSTLPTESTELRPTVILPIQLTGTPALAMVIDWEPGTRPDADLLQCLDLLTVQLNGIGSTQPTAQIALDTAAAVLARLRSELAVADRIDDAIHQVDKALHEIVAYDILRIAVFDARGQNVTQYSLGQGRNLLTERNHSISTQKTRLGELFQNPRVACIDLQASAGSEDDRWLVSCGAQQALTIPIQANGSVVAAVTLATAEPTLTQSFGARIAEPLSDALLPLIRSDHFSHQLVSYNRQILDLTSTLKKMVATEDTQSFLSELADMVVRKLPATYCRIWRYDSDQESLEFVADACARDVTRQVSETRTLSLSRTRWHKLAIQAGRMMLINQREERMQMDDQELLQSLVIGMQSALIVPMFVGREPIGIMAIAEVRNWDRRSFSLSDSLFARGIANMAAQALMSATTAERIQRLSRQIDRMEQGRLFGEMFSDLPKRLATPLTSIMARTDQLLEGAGKTDEQSSRNLAIIKMQTEKMMKDVRTLQDARRDHLVQY